MAYSTNLANLVSDQLTRLTTLNNHQLVGQGANLDFWLSQVQNALEVIDGYGVRFIQMATAQELYVSRHGTIEFDPSANFPTQQRASSPRRMPDRELRKARRNLVDAATRFLERCRQESLISDSRYEEVCACWEES